MVPRTGVHNGGSAVATYMYECSECYIFSETVLVAVVSGYWVKCLYPNCTSVGTVWKQSLHDSWFPWKLARTKGWLSLSSRGFVYDNLVVFSRWNVGRNTLVGFHFPFDKIEIKGGHD